MILTKKELNIILKLSVISALRMSGIFMILPVLTIYAYSLQGVNNHLIGIAIGIYGIMQIIFQLPFGLMSDKIGHKSVIIIGLIIFTIGSEIAAITNNIWGLIVGRAVQGAGAISAPLIALLLELIQEQHRMKAMAIIGTSFGITFALSIISGPIIANIFGLNGLLHIIALLSILAIIFTYYISTPSNYQLNYSNKKLSNILHQCKVISKNIQLLKLNFSVFCLHTILMLNFIVLPIIMTNLGFIKSMHWKIYSTIIVISAFIVLPCAFYSKSKKHIKQILFICTNILFISEIIILLSKYKSSGIFLLGMQLFFIAFSLIETILPTLISQESPQQYKGTAISIYSTGQFLGIGIGGIVGGALLEIQGTKLVLFFALIISIIFITISKSLNKK